MISTKRLLPVPYPIESSQTSAIRIRIIAPDSALEYGELTNDAGQTSIMNPSSAWKNAHDRLLDEYANAWEILAG